MKYIVILGDGMSDYPDAEGLTPLMRAHKPAIDELFRKGERGLCRTVGAGLKPASDIANLSVMGYDPRKYYTGRSPLEAISMGIEMDSGDAAYRCNLVTLSGEGDLTEKYMEDYSAGEISSAEAEALIRALSEGLKMPAGTELYPGVSYRHCLILRNAETGAELTPPHDITGKAVRGYLPSGTHAELFLDLTRQSYGILKDHPVNRDRIARGLNPANSLWLWGEGRKPALQNFRQKTRLSGAVISAVDLIKGIGIAAGMRVCEVAGATGTIHTNFEGKADACLTALKEGCDFVYVHVEAPDECGHQGAAADKVKSIEYLSERLVKRITAGLQGGSEPFSILILPDHATPLSLRTHVSDPVPYILYRSNAEKDGTGSYDERACAAAGLVIEEGHKMIDRLISAGQEQGEAESKK